MSTMIQPRPDYTEPWRQANRRLGPAPAAAGRTRPALNAALRLLLVEDNPGDARLTRAYLAEASPRSQLQISHAARLGEALELLGVRSFDVILLDLSLPDSQGLDTVISVLRVAPAAAVLVLSGLSDQELAVEAVRIGAQDYLVKNLLNEDILARAIRYAVERKQAELMLREYSERLEEMVAERTRALEAAHEKLLRSEKLAFLGQLAGGIAHTLHNPLAAIRLGAEYLEMSLEEDQERVGETLAMLMEQVDKCVHVTQGLLACAPSNHSAPVRTDLAALLRKAVALAGVFPHLRIEYSFEQEVGDVFVDPQQIRLAFENIIRNTGEALADGGHLQIWAGLDRGEGRARVSFRDDGPGIDAAQRQLIFDPLRTNELRGAGLDLALARLLIENNNGRITFDNGAGANTAFVITLPLADTK